MMANERRGTCTFTDAENAGVPCGEDLPCSLHSPQSVPPMSGALSVCEMHEIIVEAATKKASVAFNELVAALMAAGRLQEVKRIISIGISLQLVKKESNEDEVARDNHEGSFDGNGLADVYLQADRVLAREEAKEDSPKPSETAAEETLEATHKLLHALVNEGAFERVQPLLAFATALKRMRKATVRDYLAAEAGAEDPALAMVGNAGYDPLGVYPRANVIGWGGVGNNDGVNLHRELILMLEKKHGDEAKANEVTQALQEAQELESVQALLKEEPHSAHGPIHESGRILKARKDALLATMAARVPKKEEVPT